MTYASEILSKKKYVGNVVVQIGDDNFFAIRLPDSGLALDTPYDKSVVSLILNPTTIDVRKVTTTISSSTFRLLDKSGIITALVLGDAAGLIGQPVKIFLGRSNVGLDYADYFQLPITYVQKVEHSDTSYTFTCSEQTQRMTRPIYAFTSALSGDILAATTIFSMRDSIATFPTAGFLKVDDEFVSYAGVDLVNNRFTGIIRGELGSTPVDHSALADCALVETVTDNPLTILMKILISGGGTGTYDVLQDGLGIDESLVDIAGIVALRDDLFLTSQFSLSLYSIDSALKYIEDQILAPNNLRLTNSRDSKISVAILNKAAFVEEDDVIDEDTITKFPKWSIDGTQVTNIINVQWDYNEGTGQYQKLSVFQDDDSIALYGESAPLTFTFKGIKNSLDGDTLVQDFGTALLSRLSTPTPMIEVNTHIDKSLQNVGDKSYLESTKIPAADGTLNFASNLEIISRSINQTTGDVQFKLAFTSFTNFRSAFIAPSDMITSFLSQKSVNIALGRGSQYLVGWYMRLWDEVNHVYVSDAANKIVSVGLAGGHILTEGGDTLTAEDGSPLSLETAGVTEDTLVFENNFATTLVAPGRYRLRFANYDEVAESQKRYGFISAGGVDFDDGKQTYKVTY